MKLDNTGEQVAGTYEGEKLVLSYGETPLTGKKVTFSASSGTNGTLAIDKRYPG